MTGVRRFRRALGLTQRKLAMETGYTEGMISRWERGETPSEESIVALKNYAVEKGMPDAAVLLDDRPFSVKKVFLPPRSKPGGAVDLHVLLDEIIQSDDASAKLAVENILFIATQYLRGK